MAALMRTTHPMIGLGQLWACALPALLQPQAYDDASSRLEDCYQYYDSHSWR